MQKIFAANGDFIEREFRSFFLSYSMAVSTPKYGSNCRKKESV